MRHFCLKVKSAALYALPVCLFILLSFGSSFTVAEASEVSAHEIVMVEASQVAVNMDQAASDSQLINQSWWDLFWSWNWNWNWPTETIDPDPDDYKKYEPQPMYGFAWSG